MSDARLVESDKLGDEAKLLRALSDTAGMPAPAQASFWLEALAKWLHRGPRVDTWTSARDDAAECAGIRPSMAERIWHRSKEMKFVDGETLLKLMIKYEEFCEKPEAAAARYRAERSRLGGSYAAAHQRDCRHDRPVGHARHRSTEVSSEHAH